MSDTPPLVTRRTETHGGKSVDIFGISFGTDRRLEARRLTMGDQFDLAEAMPGDANRLWTSMALVAASIVSIDGVPVPPGKTKRDLRNILDKLGEDGVAAANAALAEADVSDDAEAAHRAQVGNSSPPEVSGK
jgi:hypothetical protein